MSSAGHSSMGSSMDSSSGASNGGSGPSSIGSESGTSLESSSRDSSSSANEDGSSSEDGNEARSNTSEAENDAAGASPPWPQDGAELDGYEAEAERDYAKRATGTLPKTAEQVVIDFSAPVSGSAMLHVATSRQRHHVERAEDEASALLREAEEGGLAAPNGASDPFEGVCAMLRAHPSELLALPAAAAFFELHLLLGGEDAGEDLLQRSLRCAKRRRLAGDAPADQRGPVDPLARALKGACYAVADATKDFDVLGAAPAGPKG